MSSIVVEDKSPHPWVRDVGGSGATGSARGVVAAAHPLAAQAGARILREGGNAFDAAAATAAALNVVEPAMSGIAGTGVATCFIAAEQRCRTLDFTPLLPAALPSHREQPDLDLSHGAAASAAPGNLAGWAALCTTYGRRPFSPLLQPAIEYALEGFPLTPLGARTLVSRSEDLAHHRDRLEPLLRTYGDDGRPPAPGFLLCQPRLAETFQAIQDDGIGHLYDGPLGREIVTTVRNHGGYLDLDDLARFTPRWVDTLDVAYRGFVVSAPPAPSESFQFLLTLKLLERFDFASLEPCGTAYFDAVIRAVRLAARERIANSLPTPQQLAELFEHAESGRLVQAWDHPEALAGPTEHYVPEASSTGETGLPQQHTTSLSVADGEGNVVCLTQSLGNSFGSTVLLESRGVLLNNQLQWRDRNPRSHADPTERRHPNPKSPSITLRDGKPIAAVGTPGSYGICQTQPQVLAQLLDIGLGIQEAIAHPRVRVRPGNKVVIENRVPATTVSGLRAIGHGIEVGSAWTREVGGFHGIAFDHDRGHMHGGYDPRRDGAVAAV